MLINIRRHINFSKNMGRLDQKPRFWLTTKESETIFNKFKHLIQFNEPIPDFETRFPGKLKGILASIKQTFQEEPLNATVLDAAVAVFSKDLSSEQTKDICKLIIEKYTKEI